MQSSGNHDISGAQCRRDHLRSKSKVWDPISHNLLCNAMCFCFCAEIPVATRKTQPRGTQPGSKEEVLAPGGAFARQSGGETCRSGCTLLQKLWCSRGLRYLVEFSRHWLNATRSELRMFLPDLGGIGPGIGQSRPSFV